MEKELTTKHHSRLIWTRRGVISGFWKFWCDLYSRTLPTPCFFCIQGGHKKKQNQTEIAIEKMEKKIRKHIGAGSYAASAFLRTPLFFIHHTFFFALPKVGIWGTVPHSQFRPVPVKTTFTFSFVRMAWEATRNLRIAKNASIKSEPMIWIENDLHRNLSFIITVFPTRTYVRDVCG